MRIGFDISAQSLPRSGIGQYQIHLLEALLRIDSDNFYNLYAFNLRNRERFKDIQFLSDNYKLNVIPIPQRLITLWWMMFGSPGLERVVGECDLYQVSEICIQPVQKAKTVAMVHDLTTLLFPEYHVRSNVFLHNQRFKRLNCVDGILTNSQATKSDIVKHLDINPDKIFVTHLGADKRFRQMEKEDVYPILQKYKLHKPYILFVGTLEPRKNVETLICAFNQLKQTHNIPHELVLAGQKGWLYEKIFEAIESSPFKSDIRLMDYLPDNDVPALMNGAEVFAYPSFYEGFGLPVLEAMQCGAPVVISNISSLPEVGGEACLYVHPESSDELSETLYKVLRDKASQKTLSEKGVERAKQFSWEKCAEETLKAYGEVMGF